MLNLLFSFLTSICGDIPKPWLLGGNGVQTTNHVMDRSGNLVSLVNGSTIEFPMPRFVDSVNIIPYGKWFHYFIKVFDIMSPDLSYWWSSIYVYVSEGDLLLITTVVATNHTIMELTQLIFIYLAFAIVFNTIAWIIDPYRDSSENKRVTITRAILSTFSVLLYFFSALLFLAALGVFLRLFIITL